MRLSRAVVLAGVVAGPAMAQADTLDVLPADLPVPLLSGWQAADGDPPDGMAGLDRLRWRPADPLREPGPRESVRWYRTVLDLSACRGRPLAFYAGAIRDADETYLDDVRIGGTGGFPPDVDLATIQFRLYPLPTDLVNAPGRRVLAVRVYQGPSQTPVFRFAPQIDELALTRRRAWSDQVLAALASVGVGLALAFVLFYRTVRSDPVYLLFAALSVTCVLYALAGHSLWGAVSLPPRIPHRLVMITGPLNCVLYYAAMWRLLERRPPRRFRAYIAGFLAYALLGALAPDLRWLVVPTRAIRALSLLCLVEMLAPTLRAVRQGQRRARAVLAGHLIFGLSIVVFNLTLLRPPWFYWLGAAALALLAITLYSLGAQHVQTRLAAVLAERGRIAREIHDNLAQGLVATSLQLQSVRDTLGSAAAREHLERAQALTRSSLAEARRSVWDLHPALLEGQDLPAALAQIAQRLGAGSPVRVEFEVAGEPARLTPALERALFQIGKEAITNAVTHAHARRVRVALRVGAAEVVLTVEDDGCGFDVDRPSRPTGPHFGLRGMRERAIELGGSLTVASRPQAGTRLGAVIPLPAVGAESPSRIRFWSAGARAYLRGLLGAWR